MTYSVAPHDWNAPDWDNATMVHDWRNYAGDWLKDCWGSFTDNQKKAIASTLDDIASREDWE